MQIDVRVDIDKETKGLLLFQRDINVATSAALNKVGVTARATAAREISKTTGLPVNHVRQRVPLVRATRYGLTAEISAKPYAPNLIRFTQQSRAQARKGAGVRANAWRKTKVYPGTFIGNKGRTVFAREGAGRDASLKSVRGPSVPREFIRDHTLTAINETVGTRFPLELGRALNALLRK
jgi:hypothetical protein